jgi:glutamate synthase (NADPH) large chain
MARFAPGDLVRARAADPDGHTRLPRYVRGHVGEVLEIRATWAKPDETVRGYHRRIVAAPPPEATFAAEQQVIAGNVIGYGATGGEMLLRGVVGERFCVRNSGATAVAEGTGDHGCEYMTGGRVAVLGPVGRNFAAGMSGGIAYLLDPGPGAVNTEMVDLEPLEGEDAEFLRDLVARHCAQTGSTVAAGLLADWAAAAGRFVKVMPKDYKRVLSAARRAEADGLDVNEAVMAAAQG